jgi:hypothetical protein
MKGKIKNDADWFLASVCVRCEPLGTNPKDLRRKHLTWVNTHLIHAASIAEAFDKAVALGKRENIRYKTSDGMVKWRFIGLWDLIPIWDDIADGEELIWDDYGKITAEVAKKRCVSKRQVIKRLSLTGLPRQSLKQPKQPFTE